jgi:DNA-directed RNA polymerase subunit H (RpoH/RPB5)
MLFSSKQERLNVLGREAVATLVHEAGGQELLRIEPWHVYDLSFNPIEHVDVPRQRLASAEERDAFDPECLPLMRSDDPVARWLGFEPGQIVASERETPEFGRQLYLRRVIDIDPLTSTTSVVATAADDIAIGD